MSKEDPYYLVHSYCESHFGERFNIGSVKCKHKEKGGKTFILFRSRWHLVSGTLPRITVNDNGQELDFSVSLVDY